MAPRIPTSMDVSGTHEQIATIDIQIGRSVSFKASVRITPSGLLSVGALASLIILSASVLASVPGKATR
ncbi:MAG: hypothetical protein ACRYGI_11030 [Janthinobacterium lividum]